MKYIGRVLLLSFSIIVSIVESFFETLNLMSIVEALFFAFIAYMVGWIFDRSSYYRKKAEINEKRYREIIEFSPEPILIYQQERIVFANKKLEELVGLNSERIIGKSIFYFVLPDYHSLVKERIQKANNGIRTVERMELKIKGKQNQVLDIEVASIPVIYDDNPSMEVFLKDVTDRKRLEEKSRKNEELYRFVTENSTDVISYIKPSGDYEYVSPSSDQILGYEPDEIIGESIFQFFHHEEIDTISRIFIDAKSHFDFGAFPHRYRNKDGSFIWLETNARTIRNNKKELVGIVAVSRDINERVNKEKMLLETNERLLYLAKTDGLTGIPNRRHFDETFQQEWNRTMRHSLPLSALMIDIDYFKNFNDHYGHQAGDECIKEMAEAVKSTLKRPADLVARYGGEEFVVLLPETDQKGAVFLAECILENIRALKVKTVVSEVADYVTVSIGCASIVPSQRNKPEDLIQQADQQLYLAKQSGKNKVSSPLVSGNS